MVKKKSKRTPKLNIARKQKTEMTRLGTALRYLGGLGGTFAGGLVGNPSAGSSLGSNLGATISKWLGSGDYTVSNNSIVQKMQTPMGSIPSMHNDSQTIVVRHKEYLGPVKGSTGFSIASTYNLNPGLAVTFPWLSQVASRFQEYRIRGAVFHYVPTSGTSVSGTNPALGSVMIQTSYRANDSAPSTKMEMMNEYWACESAPSEAFCHPIECNPKENPFNVQYVRNSDVPTGDSVLMYDIGQTFVATSGMPATGNVVGDLWITYEIELKKPVLYSNVAQSVVSSYAKFSAVPTSLSLFAGSVVESGNVDITAVSPSTLGLKFPEVGTWVVSVVARGSSGSLTAVGSPVYTNSIPASLDVDTLNSVEASNLSGGTGFIITFGITIVDPSVVATVALLSFAWTMSSGVSTRISITQRS